MTTIAGDAQVQARLLKVEAILRRVCDEDEFPWFVSDEATLYDVCTLSTGEIFARLGTDYPDLQANEDLRIPIWQLVDRIDHA